MKTLYSKALNECPWKNHHSKAEVTSKINSFYSYLEWGHYKRRNTKLLFLTEQAAEKVQERGSLKTLCKGYYKVTLLSKSGLLKSESCWMTMTIPLILWITSFFTCTGLSVLGSQEVYAPTHPPALEFSIPLPRKLQREMFKSWSIWALYVQCWTIYTLFLQSENTLYHMKQDHENGVVLWIPPLLNLLNGKQKVDWTSFGN